MWYIGQEIIAIENHPNLFFRKDDVFTISGLRNSCCKCNSIEIDIGMKCPPDVALICKKCNYYELQQVGSTGWFDEVRFKPLDELVNIDELTEILSNTQPFEI